MASRNNLQNAEVNSAVAAVLTLANPSTSAFMYIWAVDISAAGAATVQFFNGTGALTGVITLATGVPWVTKTDSSIPIFTVDPGTSFKITQGGTTQISGYVEYSNYHELKLHLWSHCGPTQYRNPANKQVQMKRALAFIALLALACLLSARGKAQYVSYAYNKGAGGAPVNCGVTTEGNTGTGQNSTVIGSSCVTGSDSNGYKVTGVYVYTGATGSGTVQVAIYGNTTSGCGDALSNCPTGAAKCSDSTGITPTANSWNEDTSSAITTSCPTLSANTTYWITENNNSATYGVGFVPGTCSLAPNIYFSQTYGTWPTVNPAGVNGGTTNCPSIYMVLQPQ